MRTLVCFRAGDNEYAVPVEQVREVRAGDALQPLPSARPGVVGVLTVGESALTVIAPLGAGGHHVLLLDREAGTFGLQVDAVTGVANVGEVAAAPPGQDHELIDGVCTVDDRMTMLVNVECLGERLDS